MKRTAVIIAVVITMIWAATCTTFGASPAFSYKQAKTSGGYVTKFYEHGKYAGKVKTVKPLDVKVVKSDRLTAGTLTSRRNNCIVVEVIKGKCLNKRGDGKTTRGDYISYGRVKGHKKGAKYTTYAVYGNNNSIDDVVVRIDSRR